MPRKATDPASASASASASDPVSASDPAITNRMAIFVMSGKGGVWKTALCSRIVPYLEAAGLSVGIVQVDQQVQLEAIFPGRVTTIKMPGAATLRDNDSADAEALIPLYDGLLDRRWDVVVVDVGANLDQRVAAFMVSSALHEVLDAEAMALLGLVPMHPEEEAITLGCETMARFPIALPRIRVVPVLCADSQVPFLHMSDKAQAHFDASVRPHLATGNVMHFPRLPPRAVQELGRSGLTARAYANLDPATLMRTSTQHPAVARQIQGDIIGHVADLDQELGRFFGFFLGIGSADRATAS